MALEKRVEFGAAFDKREEPGGLGRNCAMMIVGVGDSRGWVTATVFTGWLLNQYIGSPNREEFHMIPFCSPITVHSATDLNGTESHTHACPYVDGTCYTKGSFLLGDEFWKTLVEKGEAWEWLELRHGMEFGPAPRGDYSREKQKEMMRLLLEARDALPAIPLASARLRGIDLTLADRIETALQPWAVPDGTPGAI